MNRLTIPTLRTKKYPLTVGILALCVSVCVIVLIIVRPADAAPVTGFNAGRIIDDSVFTNSSSMSAGQIQAFLNSKVPTCDTWHAPGYGQNPPFICLKDYVENGRTAAQIIYDTAQQYRINPQVFIVLLQKEQGLVTDTWPLDKQYRTATGYGCPDTAPCDSQYYGLTNQLNWSGRMFRSIMDANPNWYTPYLVGNNFIRWSPNSACGGSNVNIENRSTQALYNYTPYQPNQAALNAGYGTGDGCSAYGNRNFYLYFTDWFGPTHGPSLSWQLQQQNVYTDQTKTTPASLDNLAPNQRVFTSVAVRNTGTDTWSNSGANPIRFATYRPAERWSQLQDSTWLSKTRVASLKEASVAPGQTGTFEFWIHAPLSTQSVNFKEYFNLVSEGRQWLPDIGLYYNGSIQAARYTWSMTSQYGYTDDTKTTQANMNTLMPGQRVYVGFAARNTGNMTWLNSGPNALMAGTVGPFDRVSKFAPGSAWLAGSRPSLMKEASVAPGQTGTFEFWMTVPASGVSGVYNERFGLIANDLTWLNDTGLSYYMNVR